MLSIRMWNSIQYVLNPRLLDYLKIEEVKHLIMSSYPFFLL